VAVPSTARVEDGNNPIRASMAPFSNVPHEKPTSSIIVEPYREASEKK
jgi:hypothetical protein